MCNSSLRAWVSFPLLSTQFFFISGTKIFECFTEQHHQHDHRHYWSFHLFLIRAREIIYDPISGPPKWLLPKKITDREGRIIMRLWAEICIRTISGQIRVLLRLITKHMALSAPPGIWLMRWALLGPSKGYQIVRLFATWLNQCSIIVCGRWKFPRGISPQDLSSRAPNDALKER